MTVTIGTPEPGVGATYRISLSSDLETPTFYIWFDGVYAYSTVRDYIDVNLGAMPNLTLDVFDASDDSPAVRHGSTITQYFEAQDDATRYEIQQYVVDEWVALPSIRESGAWIYKWTSPPVDDCTWHTFRIRTIGVKAIGEWREFAVYMVRPPDHPSVTYTVDTEAGKITCA